MKITEERVTHTLKQLYGLSDFETRRTTPYVKHHYNLAGIRALLSQLDHPERTFKSYHVAGTKGKGTTAFYMERFLSISGLRVGLYTSPHIFDIRERFVVAGHPLDWEMLIPALEYVLEVGSQVEPQTTLFDVLTATALLCFREQGVVVAVLETGLGGRWDATNVLSASELLATVITRIDYDHTDKLGKTLQKIATEKAEIFKPGVPAFYLQDKDYETHGVNAPKKLEQEVTRLDYEGIVGTILKAKASSLGNTLIGVSTNERNPLYHERMEVAREQLPLSSVQPWFPSVLKENYRLALTTVETVQAKQFSALQLAEVLSSARPLGRYTLYENVLLDGAHTPLSIKTLVKEIKQAPFRRTYPQVTFGFYAFFDKEIEKLVEAIPLHWDFVFCHIELPFVRAELRLEVCKRAATTRNRLGASFREVTSLQTLAVKQHPKQLFVFGGSFKLIASVCREVLGMTSVFESPVSNHA